MHGVEQCDNRGDACLAEGCDIATVPQCCHKPELEDPNVQYTFEVPPQMPAESCSARSEVGTLGFISS
jgi:hypothetical protein